MFLEVLPEGDGKVFKGLEVEILVDGGVGHTVGFQVYPPERSFAFKPWVGHGVIV